jgi:hypothetical protein
MCDCKFKPVERAGLYIMVFLAMMSSCYNVTANREQVVPVINSIDSRLKTVQMDIYDIEDKVETYLWLEELNNRTEEDKDDLER